MNYPFTGNTFRARCVRVIDGDTVELVVDLGFHQYRQDRFRLLGIDTPEMRAKDPDERVRAVNAKNYVISKLIPDPTKVSEMDRWDLLVTVTKADDFGRWLAVVEYEGQDLNAELVSRGFAVPYRP